MVVYYRSEAKFDRYIKYFHSRHCNKIVSTVMIDVFVSLLSAVRYFVVKNCKGLAVAYHVEDEIYIRGEKKDE